MRLTSDTLWVIIISEGHIIGYNTNIRRIRLGAINNMTTVTKHGAKRLKERCGVPKRAVQRNA